MIDETMIRKFRNAVAVAGDAGAADFLLSHARPCVFLVDRGSAANEGRGGGALSQMGGEPLLAADVAWPSGLDEAGQPIGSADCLVQLSLAEVPRAGEPALPDAGLLTFFLSRMNAPSGVVQYETRPAAMLRRRPAPPDNIFGDDVFSGHRTEIGFEIGFDIPFGNEDFMNEVSERYGLTLDLQTLDDLLMPQRALGQIGGFAFSDEGKEMGTLAPGAAIDPGSERPDWLLLLRLNLYDCIECLAYIRKDHLQAMDFSHVWFAGLPWSSAGDRE